MSAFDPVPAIYEDEAEDRRLNAEAEGWQLVSVTDIGPLLGPDGEPVAQVRTCRLCGCTDEYGCDGGCAWVDDDLCSECLGDAEGSS